MGADREASPLPHPLVPKRRGRLYRRDCVKAGAAALKLTAGIVGALERDRDWLGRADAERKACEIRLRAERKAGQLLQAMEKAK